MIYVHKLGGCSPTPLAHYLKALGVLRLIAEQRDPQVRAFWKDEALHLVTILTEREVVDFFCLDYAPSPITSPWNKGAGFFAKDDAGLAPIERSTSARFTRLREGIAEARKLVDALSAADGAVRTIKEETKKKGLSSTERNELRNDPSYKKRLAEAERRFAAQKGNLIPDCRREWRGVQQQWMSAAIVLTDDKPVFPSVLGTGGNDGRLDFTNNFYQRLADLFDLKTGNPTGRARDHVTSALFASPARALVSGATGQYLPGSAGGANNTSGPMGAALVNPLDFVLALEGTLLLTASVTRRLEADVGSHASAPFAVASTASGYGSAASSDEDARGEQWLPLWNSPSSMAEVRKLFAEGRARLGGKPVREPLDFARAASRLGIARGVSSFERYGYIERNGQSKLAVPLGRFRVHEPDASVRLLDELDAWRHRLRRETSSERAPARIRNGERQLLDALFALVQHPDEKGRWQRVLVALGEIETVMTSGAGFRAGPLPKLSYDWVGAADDGSPEFRLALTFALQGFPLTVGGARRRWDSIRRHAIPLDGAGGVHERFATTGDATSLRLAKRTDVVFTGRRGIDDAISLIERRLVEASQRGDRHLPLDARRGSSARLSDVAALVEGRIDVDRVLTLARPLMAIDLSSRRKRQHVLPSFPERTSFVNDAWAVIRLAMLPWPLGASAKAFDVVSHPAIVRRLAAGDADAAFQIARGRLAAAGVRTVVSRAVATPSVARLWAAALAFPISERDARRLLSAVDPPATKETNDVH